MSNKNVLYVVAAIFAVGIGVAGHYHKNHSRIDVNFEQAKVLLNSYQETEVCFRTGISPKDEKANLENIIYRLKVHNVPTKDQDFVGKVEKVKVEESISQRISVVDAIISSPDYSVLSSEVDKKHCDQATNRAKNLKKKYN